ncbi:hypothetical protein MmTuc01_0201 [Methanosarcina mazei Tuc01]|uniref:Uncharacterized protein n=1 Tax=Methanosarcina mazei Tuc01 TaxID=1236903 RepID=M1QF78_METMZ|nr:hypothetical protein MmTuc01_0201 [Methanosarcina mazei Tuc01]
MFLYLIRNPFCFMDVIRKCLGSPTIKISEFSPINCISFS